MHAYLRPQLFALTLTLFHAVALAQVPDKSEGFSRAQASAQHSSGEKNKPAPPSRPSVLVLARNSGNNARCWVDLEARRSTFCRSLLDTAAAQGFLTIMLPPAVISGEGSGESAGVGAGFVEQYLHRKMDYPADYALVQSAQTSPPVSNTPQYTALRIGDEHALQGRTSIPAPVEQMLEICLSDWQSAMKRKGSLLLLEVRDLRDHVFADWLLATLNARPDLTLHYYTASRGSLGFALYSLRGLNHAFRELRALRKNDRPLQMEHSEGKTILLMDPLQRSGSPTYKTR